MTGRRDFPSPVESLDSLRGLGWTAEHIGTQGVSSDLVHMVLGTDGHRSILVMAQTEREAWHRALQGAHASAAGREPATAVSQDSSRA